jgi:uncharacterized protein (DUF4415 family)
MNTTSRTDWKKIDALRDRDVDTSDIPPLNEDFFTRAQWREPLPGLIVAVPIDAETLAWYEAQGETAERQMSAALRIYADAHRMQDTALKD